MIDNNNFIQVSISVAFVCYCAYVLCISEKAEFLKGDSTVVLKQGYFWAVYNFAGKTDLGTKELLDF